MGQTFPLPVTHSDPTIHHFHRQNFPRTQLSSQAKPPIQISDPGAGSRFLIRLLPLLSHTSPHAMNRGRGASRGSRAGSAAGNASSTTPGGRGTPSSSSSTTARGGGPGARRATAAAPVARFRPKNIRRDEAERENIAREEERKESQIEADERRANRGRGGRFRAKRGRGDAMGASFGRGVGTASGPFSSIASGTCRQLEDPRRLHN